MIESFRHKGLRLLFEAGDRRKLPPELAAKINRVLLLLSQASEPADLDLPGLRLHPLKGELAGFWAVRISGNWRIVFRFDDGQVKDVDLIDYH